MKLALLLAIIAILCSAFVFAQEEEKAQQGLYIFIESKTTETGAQVGKTMDTWLLACAYGVPKVDSTEDKLKHWFGIITTPLQKAKSECNENSLKLAIGTNGSVKTYKFDESWSYETCTSQTDRGPTPNCAKGSGKCEGSILCNNTTTYPLFAAAALVVVSMFF